jgi:acetolactate synthase I/III small subunit
MVSRFWDEEETIFDLTVKALNANTQKHRGRFAGFNARRSNTVEDNEGRHIITMLVENVPGVTARVSGLFAGRGYNIETICGAPTADPDLSRITITTKANPAQLEMIIKQIRRLINVVKVRDMTGEKAVKREMALICLKAKDQHRSEIQRIVQTFQAKIVDTGISHYIVEVIGGHDKVDALIRLLAPMGIKKVTRSGVLALYREPE